MATRITITTNEGSSNYTLSTGARGPAGAAGATGHSPAALEFAGSDPNVDGPTGDYNGQPLYCTGTSPASWWKWLDTDWIKDIPESLTVDKIVLGDASALTLDPGELSGDADGNPVIGDGVTLGGRRLMYDLPTPSQHGIALKGNFVPADGSSYFLKLGEIKVPAELVSETLTLVIAIDCFVTLVGFTNLTDLAVCFKDPSQVAPKEVILPAYAAPGSNNKTHRFEGVQQLVFTNYGNGPLNLQSNENFIVETYPTTSGAPSAASVAPINAYLIDFEDGVYTTGVEAVLEIGVWIKTSNAQLSGTIAAKAKWTYYLFNIP